MLCPLPASWRSALKKKLEEPLVDLQKQAEESTRSTTRAIQSRIIFHSQTYFLSHFSDSKQMGYSLFRHLKHCAQIGALKMHDELSEGTRPDVTFSILRRRIIGLQLESSDIIRRRLYFVHERLLDPFPRARLTADQSAQSGPRLRVVAPRRDGFRRGRRGLFLCFSASQAWSASRLVGQTLLIFAQHPRCPHR